MDRLPLANNAIILSIRPQWAEAILGGRKRWEYRKIAPVMKEHYRVVLYATANVRSIVGEAYAVRVLKAPVTDLITRTVPETPHSFSDVELYFTGRPIGYALELVNPLRYPTPLTLSLIRKHVPNFSPPENFFYLRPER